MGGNLQQKVLGSESVFCSSRCATQVVLQSQDALGRTKYDVAIRCSNIRCPAKVWVGEMRGTLN